MYFDNHLNPIEYQGDVGFLFVSCVHDTAWTSWPCFTSSHSLDGPTLLLLAEVTGVSLDQSLMILFQAICCTSPSVRWCWSHYAFVWMSATSGATSASSLLLSTVWSQGLESTRKARLTSARSLPLQWHAHGACCLFHCNISNRPHYRSCPSVCPFVCMSVCHISIRNYRNQQE